LDVNSGSITRSVPPRGAGEDETLGEALEDPKGVVEPEFVQAPVTRAIARSAAGTTVVRRPGVT
jgi:hypothetical protein